MSERFKAILVSRDEDKKQSVAVTELTEADLMDGDVTVAVEATTVNYKDGLAITGKAPVVRRFPLVPGIDFAGTVISSSHPDWKQGDKVILNGWGVGETHHGAFAERARVKGDWLVPLPEGMSARDAMAVGTAGYTAMLSVMALERHGITPDRGPVVVTGAAGGVGSVAIAILSKLGYHVIASTGRTSESAYLTRARRRRDHLARRAFRTGEAARQGALGGRRRRGRQPYAGQCAVDDLLWRRGRRLRPGAGMDLPSSVAPFILRGVSLLGIDSVMAPKRIRLEAWRRIAHRSRPWKAVGAVDRRSASTASSTQPGTSSTARSGAASSSRCD